MSGIVASTTEKGAGGVAGAHALARANTARVGIQTDFARVMRDLRFLDGSDSRAIE
jgi:hypothetical protein